MSISIPNLKICSVQSKKYCIHMVLKFLNFYSFTFGEVKAIKGGYVVMLMTVVMKGG